MAKGLDVGADEIRKYPVRRGLPGQAKGVDGYLWGQIRYEILAQRAHVLVELPGIPDRLAEGVRVGQVAVAGHPIRKVRGMRPSLPGLPPMLVPCRDRTPRRSGVTI